MGLVLWAVLAIRPLVPAQAQDRLGNLLPKFLRPLSTNQWLSGTGVGRRWDINLGLILFCLVPALLAGPLAVLYLRARASHLLWRSTWIVALWSTLRAAAEGAEWVWSRLYHTVVHNQPLFGPMQVYTALESQLGYWLPRLQVEALAGILFAVLCCATVPRARASRWSRAALALMLVFACCFLVIALRWLPAPAPGGVPTDLQMMQDFMTRELLKQKP
jgi:hypothetical protein